MEERKITPEFLWGSILIALGIACVAVAVVYGMPRVVGKHV